MPSNVGGTKVDVFRQSVTLTNAQFKALPTTPFLIVPAGGAGTVIRWVGAWLTFNNAAGVYDNPSENAYLQLVHLTPSFPTEASGLIFMSPVMVSASVWTAPVPPFAGFNETEGYLQVQPTGSAADIRNVGLGIADIYNGNPDYTGGNAANSMDVTVLYTIIDV